MAGSKLIVMLFRRVLFLGLLFFSFTHLEVRAQEQVGIRIENYSGVNGLTLNPAHNSTSRLSWDIHLTGGAFFLENNYGFLVETSLLRLVRERDSYELRTLAIADGEGTPPANPLYLDFPQEDPNRYYGTFLSEVIGPSFMVRLKNGHTFGAFTRFRAMGSGRLPANLGFYNYYEYPELEELPVQTFKMGVMTWGELGFNYGYSWETQTGTFGFGVNLRYLQGFEGVYFDNRREVLLQKESDKIISSNAAELGFGFTSSNIDGMDVNLQRNGGGFGLDAGFMITGDGYGQTYQWKFGASLIDIGSIRFFRNAQAHRVVIDESVTVDGERFENLDSLDFIQAAVDELSFQLFGDTAQSLVSDAFTIALPTALTLQGEYAFNDYFFLHGLYVQSLAFPAISVRRGDLLALTPRVEHRWFGAGMPISLYNWSQFRVGLYGKVGPLTIGTEKLGAWLSSNSDLTGMDVYLAFKFPPFLFQRKGNSLRRLQGRAKGSNVGCYKW